MTTSFYGRRGKRLFDVVLAAVALLVALPLMAMIAVIVALVLGRPVLFRQVRPGLRGRPFRLVKFRTMTTAGERDPSVPDERRMTALGRVLRSTSLDELPELWNVIKGDMSVVGPRPLLMQYLPLYSAEQSRRHDVRPGLTGWAQIKGRNAVSWAARFQLDVWYVDHVSFVLDVRILLGTLATVLLRQGISAANCATMPAFQGSQATSHVASDVSRLQEKTR